uniref:Phosphodiesterase n=1 Tax=Chlamydomonas leiostraca TaxID=1034604 RepID=A0A7S0RAQ3_9CHLO|mmetsp:Transcript_17852/g.45035  ORF Transcript_17852/g.45035 Transcript_17852/m.45035 type:complete len:828 (+) Transcript_17852:269-2752(+)
MSAVAQPSTSGNAASGQVSGKPGPPGEVINIKEQAAGLNLVATPLWLYDCNFCANVWGNRAALELFGVDEAGFRQSQLNQLGALSPEQLKTWKGLNDQMHQDVEVDFKEISLTVTSLEPTPGFLTLNPAQRMVLRTTFRPVQVLIDGAVRVISLVQVVQQTYTDIEENHLRMVEICNNHPMFQFLFDENGKLLAANKRAMYNMKEHLGSCENYNLQMYLSIGECDGSLGPDDMYLEAMRVIFKENKPCHRFPQLRWSKRHPGKYRWVLYEMWPLTDPITHQKAVLVCEQNISQVKALEEQFKKQNQRLEAQLEEALAQRDPVHKPAIDIDTPADKTLKLLDKIMRGHEVSAREAMDLRDAILHAGDLRQPVNFNEQLMKNSQTVLDNEVSQSLIQLLSSKRPAKIEEEPAQHVDEALPHLRIKTQPVTQESVRNLIALSKNMPDEVVGVLAKVDDWQFDAFKLNEVSNGRPLSMLSFALFKRCEIVDKWGLHEHKLVKFLMKIEDGYPNNPYHNRIHAADVLQSLHVLVIRGGLINHGYCDETALVSCYLSSIIHDYEHKGVNNDYLIRVSDSLAVLYNDRSPMENHHLAASFQLMNSDEYNFMPKVPHKVREMIRKQVIDMVLATDMKQHFAIHSMFQAKMQLNGSRPSGGSGGKSLRGSPHSTVDGGGQAHKPVDDDQKSLVLQVALKCADLGHLAAPRAVHGRWVSLLEEELFRQGDLEKAKSLAVSALMDRTRGGITKSQTGFFNIVALPLYSAFCKVFPGCRPQLDAVTENYEMWREEEEREKAAEHGTGGMGSRAMAIKRGTGSVGSPAVVGSPVANKSIK